MSFTRRLSFSWKDAGKRFRTNLWVEGKDENWNARYIYTANWDYFMADGKLRIDRTSSWAQVRYHPPQFDFPIFSFGALISILKK